MAKMGLGKGEKGEAGNPKPNEEKSNREKIYQLRISLTGSDPEIWRSVLVSGNETLGRLHSIIQDAMGWDNDHLHEFIMKDRTRFADREAALEGSRNEDKARLCDVAPRVRSSFVYVYDFGDDWHHKIKVEKVLDRDDGFSGKPVCVAGERACPPEDCGGLWGYYSKLEVLGNRRHPEYEDVAEWLGEDFDPEGFDLNEVNKRLGG
jgi:hypothetical protein